MIDPSSQIAAMVRARFGTGPRASSNDRSTPREKQPNLRPREAAIEQTIALRVAALSPHDPQRQRKAFRIFLESVLLQAFCRRRLDDRGFDEMVDAVLQRMESDAELNAALQQAGAVLAADAPPSDRR